MKDISFSQGLKTQLRDSRLVLTIEDCTLRIVTEKGVVSVAMGDGQVSPSKDDPIYTVHASDARIDKTTHVRVYADNETREEYEDFCALDDEGQLDLPYTLMQALSHVLGYTCVKDTEEDG